MPKYKFLTSSDADEWRRHLPASQSVFGSVEYALICERFRGVAGRLSVFESETASIFYPMLLRPLSELPFAGDVSARWDATTPEYTGPFLQGSDDELAAGFPANCEALARDYGIVAEFAHLHPWSAGRDLLREGCVFNRDIVWVDTTLDPEEIFNSQMEHSCRKKVKQAQREGVIIRAESCDRAIEEFYRIYTGTMQRRNAHGNYFYSAEYFKAVRDGLPENARFTFAEHGGKVIAAVLYLYDGNEVYSFLSGADTDFNHLRPTNLLFWETITWAHETGKARLILGGGYKPNDGVYQFKSSFSPLRQPFYVYRNIRLEEEYALLEKRCRDYYGQSSIDEGYFPSYRGAAAKNNRKSAFAPAKSAAGANEGGSPSRQSFDRKFKGFEDEIDSPYSPDDLCAPAV